MSPRIPQAPRLIGLTGGIGSGKSAAAARFAESGAAVVDTDAIAHALTAPGGGALPGLLAAFGPGILAADGSLERAPMRARAFADAGVRQRLEAILHPLIRAEGERQIAAATAAPYLILVVPLLVETGVYRERLARIAVVDCTPQTQISRVMARSGLAREEVDRIMAAQASRAQRLAVADDILDNEGSLAALREQVDRLDEQYRRLR